MRKQNTPRIFLSHSHADRSFSRRIAADLKLAGAQVWFDEAELEIGDSLIERISKVLTDTTHLAIVLSPVSVKSKWVKRELEIVLTKELKGHKVKILPLFYRTCKIPAFLKPMIYADFRREQDYMHALNLVKKTLKLPESIPEETLEKISSQSFTYDMINSSNIIVGSAQFLLKNLKDKDDFLARLANNIAQTGFRQARIAKNIYYLFEFEQGRYTVSRDDIELSDIFDRVQCDIEGLADRKNQKLIIDTGPNIHIKGVAWLLEMALYNLIENAIRYGNEESTIRAVATTTKNIVHITVENIGLPIDPADVNLIFLRGVRGSNARTRDVTGHGIGLYFARLVIEAQGGTIYLDKARDDGLTRFVIELPLTY